MTYLNNTLADIRRGRQSWRVFLAVCTPSFAFAVFRSVSAL